MENTEKKYVSHLGYDYTEFVKTDEDRKKFERLCECEKNSHRPLKECVNDVAEVLNLDAELRGFKKRAYVQGNANSN
jgi:hypothetical protein